MNHLVYADFGELVEQTNPEFGIIYGYTSQELDPESGLYDYDGRYYDPILAQFASEDPLGFAAGDVNLYRYVGNSPVNYNDPTGMDEWGPLPDPEEALNRKFSSWNAIFLMQEVLETIKK